MLNPKFICVIGIVSSYLGNWGKRVNFGNGIAEIQQKYEKEIEKVGEKILNFGNHITEIPAAQIADRVGVKCPKGNQLWQCHCWNRGKKFVTIVAMPLLKMGEKKSKFGEELKKKILHQQYFYNIFTINYRWLVKFWI